MDLRWHASGRREYEAEAIFGLKAGNHPPAFMGSFSHSSAQPTVSFRNSSRQQGLPAAFPWERKIGLPMRSRYGPNLLLQGSIHYAALRET
jgi:hypothetical protein